MEIRELPFSKIKEFVESEWKRFYERKGISFGYKIHYLSAIDKGKIIGFVKFQTKCKTAKIESLLVKENMNNQGIGSALLSNMEKIAKNEDCNQIILETSEIHIGALKFYKKRGYEILANIPHLYYDKEWYILKKNI